MAIAGDLVTDFNEVVSEHGVPIRITYETPAFTAGDYDTATWSASGTSFSGTSMMSNVGGEKGGVDYQYIEQGIVNVHDTKLFMAGSLALSGTNTIRSIIDIRISGNTYDVIERVPYQEAGSSVFQKVFVRKRV